MSCEQLSKDVTYDNYDNIKSHKKPEFHPFSTVEGTFLEKALTPPLPLSRFRVENNFEKLQRMATFAYPIHISSSK